MPLTINDIARLGKCSKATVSAVLNEKPGISRATRERILDIVKKYNYKPSQLARSLYTQKTRTIGLVIKEIDNPFFAKLMRGVYQVCAEHDYTVLLGSSELSVEHQRESIDALKSQQVEGIIISPLYGDDVNQQLLFDIQTDRCPVVLLNDIGLKEMACVGIDNRKAAREAVAYLIANGHTRIGCLAGPEHSINAAERVKGYKEALDAAGLPREADFIKRAGSTIEDGYRTGKAVFQKHQPFSAVLCYNDMIAVGFCNALHELGKRIPQDVSVIGFDNIEFCSAMRVPLTSIDVPAYEIGKTAAAELFKLLNDPVGKKRQTLIETYLVERESVKKKKGENIDD